MIAVLLDINVVLDVFLARSPWPADAALVIQAGLDGRIRAHLSAATLPTIFYLVRRNADLDRREPSSRSAWIPSRSCRWIAGPWSWRRACRRATSRITC